MFKNGSLPITFIGILGFILLPIVVPIFNESESIEAFVKGVEELNINFEVIFVCDPCSDDSVVKIKNIVSKNNKNYKTIIMSRRFGQHKCIIAGLDHASGDAVIVMDVDGQDPVEAIPEMIQKWTNGFDVVYGKCSKELSDKRQIVKLPYTNTLTPTIIPQG